MLLMPRVARADDFAAPQTSRISDLFKTFFALAFVLALFFVILHFLKRFQGHARSTSRTATLRALGRMDLGQRREIRIVEVADRVLVLGVTTQQVTLLTEFDAAADEVAEGAPHETPESVSSVGPPRLAGPASGLPQFARWMQKLTTSL